MKCKACGYRYNEDEGNEEYKPVSDGEEEFELIQGNFTIKRTWESPSPVYLYACPACGTVRMERW